MTKSAAAKISAPLNIDTVPFARSLAAPSYVKTERISDRVPEVIERVREECSRRRIQTCRQNDNEHNSIDHQHDFQRAGLALAQLLESAAFVLATINHVANIPLGSVGRHFGARRCGRGASNPLGGRGFESC